MYITHLDLLDDLTEGRTVPDTVLPGDPHLLRALSLRRNSIGYGGGGGGARAVVRGVQEWRLTGGTRMVGCKHLGHEHERTRRKLGNETMRGFKLVSGVEKKDHSTQ